MTTDYYELLGIDKTSTPEEIKSAYRSLAKCYHPDVNHAKNAVAFFRLIQEAYETLSDPQKRLNYDNQSTQNNFASDNNADYEQTYSNYQQATSTDGYSNHPHYSLFDVDDIFQSGGFYIADVFNAKFVLLESFIAGIIIFFYAHVEFALKMEYSVAIAIATFLLLIFLFQIKIVVWIITAIFSFGWGWLAFDIAQEKSGGNLKASLIAAGITLVVSIAFHCKDALDT